MAYSPSNTFTNNTQLSATDVEQNFQEARDYINNEIQGNDLEQGTFTLLDVGEGEFFGVTDDYVFPVTGDMFSESVARKNSQVFERLYHTCTVKSYDPQISVRYTSLYGKEFYMEAPGNILITCNFYANGGRMDPCKGSWFPWNAAKTNANGMENAYYLAMDGVVDSNTIAHSFNENVGTWTPSSLVATTIANPETLDPALRRYVYLQYMSQVQLSRGWHKIQVVVDSKNPVSWIDMRNLTLEVFYDPGYSPNTQSKNGMNQTYPSVVF